MLSTNNASASSAVSDPKPHDAVCGALPSHVGTPYRSEKGQKGPRGRFHVGCAQFHQLSRNPIEIQ
jgi:hypothetical protein